MWDKYWSDPKNRDAQRERKRMYYSDPKNRQASIEAIPFNPKAKTHTRNQWRKSGLLRQPYQCAKCGKQYEGESFDYLQHMENCNKS